MKTNQPKKKYEEMTLEEKNAYNEERIIYLEAENEYLKKLRAVVQARKNRTIVQIIGFTSDGVLFMLH